MTNEAAAALTKVAAPARKQKRFMKTSGSLGGRWMVRLAGLWAALLCAAPGLAADTATARRPNIVFVLIDDAGFSDFGSYGSEIATPVIDSLAKEGMRFSNFHTASTCEASRVMLQSGVDNHRAGAGTLLPVIAANQKGKPGYEGHLSDNVHSLGQLMRDAGYATYYTGKWNIGDGIDRSPGARGWDRYMSLEQTGADNYEAKVYTPLYADARWWEDGKPAVLPPDFYSSRHYVDKMIQFIDEGRASGKPFMSIVAFQAVHSPHQAPKTDVDKYVQRYEGGWTKIRAERYARQVALGLMPADLLLPQAPFRRDWDKLSVDDKRLMAKKMAVYAGMLDSTDQQIGRLREHLRQIGQLDNTVFIVMSDNGADPYDLSQVNFAFKAWYHMHYALDYDSLGAKGAYSHYGQEWAEVSNTPFAYFKGTSSEGGMRVPFIVAWPGRLQGGRILDAFTYATDFLPTVLDIAGVPLPGDEYKGKKLLRPTGTSLLPYMEGKAPAVHPPAEVIGYEGTGAQVVYRGDYKLKRDGAPWGDGDWRLFKVAADPTEATDLASSEPERVRQLLAEVEAFNQRNGVVLPEAGYNPLKALLANNWTVLFNQMKALIVGVFVVLVGLIYLTVRVVRRAPRPA